MKTFIFTVWLLIAAPAIAQVGTPFPGPGTPHTTVAGYTGPGDIVSGATAWWGIRAYNNTNADGTHKAIQLQRLSDSETCDVFLNTSGQLGLTTACTGADNGVTTVSFCNATTCTPLKFYDQTGNAHDASLVAGGTGSPTLTTSATIASQNVQWALGNTGFCTAGTVSMPQTVSVSAVAQRTTSGAFNDIVGFAATPTSQVGANTAANQLFIYSGTLLTVAASDSVWHAVQAEFAGASSKAVIDGSVTSGLNPGVSGSATANLCFGAADTLAGNPFRGFLREAGLWPNAAAATFDANLAALNSNQHAYWGF